MEGIMENKIRFAIIGTGSRGVHCFGKLLTRRDDCVVQALCDTNAYRGQVAAETLGIPAKVYPTVAEMLKHETIDAAVVTTPDAEHEACAVDLLNAGIGVLVDKPLSPELSGCRNILEAAKKNGKVAMMGFNLRHVLTLKKLKELVDKGELGRIFLIENREFYDGGRTYMSRWNGKKSLSGGLWIHKGSHDFDIFNWLLGFPKPKKVFASCGMNVFLPDSYPFALRPGVKPGPCCSECPYGKNGGGECRDCFTYEGKEWGKEARKLDGYVKDSCMYQSDLSVHDNGIATVEYENGVRASHMECFVAGMTDRKYTVCGTLGVAEVSLAERKIVITKRWSMEKITYDLPEETGGHGGADPALVESFVRAVKGGDVPQASLREGMLATAIAEAAELSREEGRVVYPEV